MLFNLILSPLDERKLPTTFSLLPGRFDTPSVLWSMILMALFFIGSFAGFNLWERSLAAFTALMRLLWMSVRACFTHEPVLASVAIRNNSQDFELAYQRLPSATGGFHADARQRSKPQLARLEGVINPG
jgi:hypothetical protein